MFTYCIYHAIKGHMQREKMFANFEFILKYYVNKHPCHKKYQKILLISTSKPSLKIAFHTAQCMNYLPLISVICDVTALTLYKQ